MKLGLVLGALIVVVIFCCTSKTNQEQLDIATTSATPIKVEVFRTELRKYEYVISTTGKVEGRREAEIKLNVGGVMAEILVENGQYVVGGQTLAQMDDQRYKFALQTAQVQVEVKRIEYQDQLLAFPNLSDQKRETVERNIRYSCGLAAAEAQLAEAEYDYECTRIRSYFAGIISDISIKEGGTGIALQTFCKIHDPNDLSVSCEILESDAFLLGKGTSATIESLFSKNGERFVGEISAVNPRVTESSGMLKVNILLKQKTNLLPGMTVNVAIKILQQKTITVPKEAIVIRSGRRLVFVAQNGFAKWVYVKTGKENGKEIEIVEGLQENENVIVTNNLQLSHNTPILIGSGV